MEPPHLASCGFPAEPPAAGGCPTLGGSLVSLKTAAAMQTVEQSVDAHGSRLLNLESRVAATEKNHLERGKTAVDFGNQLESKCTALGTLIQEYEQLQRRLKSIENFLKSGNLWILQLPPRSTSPGWTYPSVVFQSETVCFSAQEWADLQEQQRELRIKELGGNNEPQICLDYAISKHDLLSQHQRGEASCNGDEAASKEVSAEPSAVLAEALLFKVDVNSQDGSAGVQEGLEGRAVLAEPGPCECCSVRASLDSGAGRTTREEPSSATTTTEEVSSLLQHTGIPEPSFAGVGKQEEERCMEEQGTMKDVEFTKLSVVPANEAMTFKVEQLDLEECSQRSKPPVTLTREPKELLSQGPSKVLSFDSQYSCPVEQGNQSMSSLVPSTPEGEGLSESNAINFHGQNCPRKRPHSCTACGKGFCLKKMLTPHQEGHSTEDSSEHTGGEDGFLYPLCHQTHVEEDGTHVATERFKQNQNAKAPTSVPAVDKVSSSPRCLKSNDANAICKLNPSAHPKGRPYKCNQCKACFSQKKTLGSHKHTHLHQRRKILRCLYCGKRFTCSSSVVQHQRIHTDERPYTCNECPKCFTQKEHLLQHERIHLHKRDSVPGVTEKPESISALSGSRSLVVHGESRIPLDSAVPRAASSPPAGGRRSARGRAAAGGAAVPAAEAAAAGVGGAGGAGGAAMAGPEAERAEAQAVAARLLRLEARLARAERQLRAALALRGRLQALERRLETGGGCSGCCGGAPRMSAKRWAAGGGRRAARPQIGQGPVSLEDVWVQFSEQEWRALRGWQQALHRAVMRSNYHMLLSLEPDAPRCDTQAQSEDEVQPCVQNCMDGDGRNDPAESEDSIIHIKQEEELASADQQEVEARKAAEEPCPAEQAFCEPESSNQPKKGKEVHARELPGVEGEDLPGDPDAGFQTYATDVFSWIKQEEEPRCPEQQDLEKEVSADPSTVHDGNTKRDPPADCFESTAHDSEVPGRPGEQFSKDPSPRVTWDSQWNSEMMETNSAGNSLGDDAQHTRGFGEYLDFFSTQENSDGKRLCSYNKREKNSTQQEHLQAPQGAREGDTSPGLTCERSLNERAFRVLHSQPCAAGEKRDGQGPASASYEGLPMGPQLATHPYCRQNPAGEPGLHEHHGLGGEEQPPAESEENFPAENPLASPCWDHPQDKAEACSRCQQHLAPRSSPAGQQQSQGRGKSYICSDCGKGFVCHSWLVRHQMTHTGERPYKCSKCDKTYRRKDYLLNHLRRHSGEGLFQCSICRKRFVLRRSLVKHQESHLKETHLALASWPCTEIRGAVMHSI
ncbi:LOW QUALITY PROTEIN: uncharacterized protein LOC130595849 [Pezoporus wallicus]|uniref:LOW QUALITY PROTEIN: uncharacterized protein LOC130595849 n=1 Tax=Pezoporus wallicus TaxID=35540 RepID=UPI0025502D4E|nr:LOW QUALITY PROTEIN: uncharacterized protein LOC130595849 [Pezoporus wallicus]